nr:hypothetical protein [Tanacetum cinerariifolium]
MGRLQDDAKRLCLVDDLKKLRSYSWSGWEDGIWDDKRAQYMVVMEIDDECEHVCDETSTFIKLNTAPGNSKGTRTHVVEDPDHVDIMIDSHTDQVMHTQVIIKADKKMLYSYFIYAWNEYIQRRIIWHNLKVHNANVRGHSWVFMVNFNDALNLEDCYAGSSKISISMREFKEYVGNIEVQDVNSSGLYYTWNKKPKGGGSILKKLD